MGKVTDVKNIQFGPSSISGEALTAIPNDDGTGDDGTGYWVLAATRDPRNFLAFKFDGNGPIGGTNAVPVITELSENVSGLYGSIYTSADLKRVVFLNSGKKGADGNNYVHILEPNAKTGEFKELVAFKLKSDNSSISGYAADFLPSGRYLYVSFIYNGRLWRYDLDSLNATEFLNSDALSGTVRGNGEGQRRRSRSSWPRWRHVGR